METLSLAIQLVPFSRRAVIAYPPKQKAGMEMSVSSSDWRRGTKRFEIARMVEKGLTAAETYSAIKPLVQAQSKPWVFSANTPGGRKPKPMGVQFTELRHEINRVFARFNKEGLTEIDSDEMELPSDDEEVENELKRVEEVEKGLPKNPTIEDEKRFFLREVQRIRAWISKRAETADTVDEISMRPVIAAKTAIPAGIPAKALLAMMTMHWNPETRQSAEIESFDFEAFSQKELAKRELESSKYHRLVGIALLLADARVPVMAIGPSGTGKSHLAKQVADILGLAYGECPMTAGATPSWLLGSNTIEGFISRPFLECYSKGGVFNFEEIDASDPNMLLVANNALASDKLFNPMNGESYDRHPDFIAFSTANTFGLGANRSHSARERLDAATIDRWRMGRVFVPIDEDLESSILFS